MEPSFDNTEEQNLTFIRRDAYNSHHATHPVVNPSAHRAQMIPFFRVMMPHGHSAPIRYNLGPIRTARSSYVESIQRACEDIQIGDYVRARRWDERKLEYGEWTEGIVQSRSNVTSHAPDDLLTFSVRHVNQHTRRGYTKVYHIENTDQLEFLKGDKDELEAKLQERPQSVAPCMGPIRAFPSQAVSKVVAERDDTA